MMMKTLYAISLYLLITGLTCVSGNNNILQSSFFGDNCMFVGNITSGSPITMTTCSNGRVTFWDISGDNEIKIFGTNLCIDSTDGVFVEDCNGSEQQQWSINDFGQIILGSSIGSRDASDDSNSEQCITTPNGINVLVDTCNLDDQTKIWIASQ